MVFGFFIASIVTAARFCRPISYQELLAENPLSSSCRGISSDRKLSISTYLPFPIISTSCERHSLLPCASMLTVPSGSFCTQPVTPSMPAAWIARYRKPTPCTLPEKQYLFRMILSILISPLPGFSAS